MNERWYDALWSVEVVISSPSGYQIFTTVPNLVDVLDVNNASSCLPFPGKHSRTKSCFRRKYPHPFHSPPPEPPPLFTFYSVVSRRVSSPLALLVLCSPFSLCSGGVPPNHPIKSYHISASSAVRNFPGRGARACGDSRHECRRGERHVGAAAELRARSRPHERNGGECCSTAANAACCCGCCGCCYCSWWRHCYIIAYRNGSALTHAVTPIK